jgi:hypothetical protein
MTAHPIPELDRKGFRKFGLTTGAIFAVLFGLIFPWLLERPWPLWPWIIFAVLGGLGLVAPMALKPIYYGWMKFGLLASKVTTPLILGLLFYLMISPISLVRRMLGHNDMRRPFASDAATYRIPSNRSEPANLEKPF